MNGGERGLRNKTTQSGKTRAFEIVAIEEVVSIEGNKATVGMDDVNAGLLDAANVEGVGVEELNDEDAENILVAEFGGRGDSGEAAEEFAQRCCARLKRVSCGEVFEKAIADSLLFFVDDGVARGVDEDVRIDEASERDDVVV